MKNPIDVLPISGGNSVAVNNYLMAMNNENVSLYMMLIDQLKYHRNIFIIEGDESLKNAWLNIETALFWYGIIGIQLIDDKVVVYGLSEVEINNANEIISAKGTYYLNQGRKSNISNIPLNNENAIFIKRNQEGWGAWIFQFFRYETLNNIQKYFFVNLEGSQKKVAFSVKGAKTEELAKEIKHIKNPDTWYLLINDTNDGVATKIQDTIKDLSIPNETALIWQAFENYKNWIYYHDGRRFNIGEKDERNLVDEVQINTVNFDVLENDRLFWLKIAIDQYNKMYNKNASVVKMFDKLKTNNEIQMEEESIKDVKNEL